MAHTSSSGTPADGPDGVFDSSLVMARRNHFLYTFDDAGTYRLLLYGSSMDAQEL